MKNLLIAVLIILINFCGISAVFADATINAASCSNVDIQTAVNSISSSHSGKVTVQIPACSTTTWSSSGLIINMGSTSSPNFTNVTEFVLRGAGTTPDDNTKGSAKSTNIGLAAVSSYTTGIQITGVAGKKWRISNFLYTGGPLNGVNNWIWIRGNTRPSNGGGFRIDHLDFYNFQPSAQSSRKINIECSSYGVIDHNTSYIESSQGRTGMFVSVSEGKGAPANQSWYRGIDVNSFDQIFVEDNDVRQITPMAQSMFADCVDGGRLVVRGNTIQQYYLGGHGADSVYRSCLSYIGYDNTFILTDLGAGDANPFLDLRDGTHIMYDNIVTETRSGVPVTNTMWGSPIYLRNYRSAFGICGTMEEWYDHGNFPYDCDGTADSLGDKRCFDNSNSPARKVDGSLVHCTTDADCDGGTGSCWPVDNGSSGTTGYPCRDQIGITSKGGYGASQFTPYPSLFANNQRNGVVVNPYVPSSSTNCSGVAVLNDEHIQNNRDYCYGASSLPTTCNGVATEYREAAYPHPLIQGIIYEDLTPPIIQSSSPSGNVEYSATKTITLQTNENANCTFCTTGGTCDADASFTEVFVLADFAWMTNTGGTTHSMTINVEPSTEYSYYFSCRDISANQNAMTGVSPYTPRLVNFTTGSDGGGDSNAPVMSNPLPSGSVYPCGSNVTLQVDATDDSGTVSGCRYNATDVAYASMSGTFDAPGGIPTSQVTDSYDVSATLALEISGNAAHRTEAGKSFTATIAGTLDNIRFRLGKYGSPTGNVTVKVYAHTGTYGTSSVPTGDALATSDNVDVSGLTTSNPFVTFTFSGANRISLTEGTYYVATVAYGGGDASNYVRIYRESTTLGHSGNDVRNDSGSWAAYTTREAPFYVTVIQGGSGSFSDTLTAPTCGQSYTYYYRCTDGSNSNTSSQTATFTIAGGVCPIAGCIEFEAGTNASPMIEYTDAAASGGQYVATTTDLQGTSTHSVVIGTAGTYRIIARVNAADTGTDSIFLAIDGGDAVMLALNHTFASTNWNTWREEALHSLVNNAWTEYHVTLTADTHSFVFTGRETGAKLDYFYLDRIEGPLPPHIGTTRFMIGTGQTMVVAPTTGGCQVIIE